ncbi:MAG: NAD(P)H-dependent oxidoreductase [Polyangiaceae bacterium]
MKATIVYAHPYDRSFNFALYQQALRTCLERGVTTHCHDLYADEFNPVLTKEELGKKPTTDALVKRYTSELLASDILVFVHPNWWGQPPAILKGYIDRILRPPHAYDFSENDSGGGLPIGKLAGKVGVVLNTSNTEEQRELTYFRDPLESIWKQCIFGFCGITVSARRAFRIIADSTDADRIGWLREVDELLGNVIRGKAT